SVSEFDAEKTHDMNKCSKVFEHGTCGQWNVRSEAAPVGRHAVVAMQFRFLRPIAPLEILVSAERWRALQLLIVNVEFVGFAPHVVTQFAPRQWKQIGSHAKEAAETQHRVGYFPRN